MKTACTLAAISRTNWSPDSAGLSRSSKASREEVSRFRAEPDCS